MTTSPAVVASRTFVTWVSATPPLSGSGVSRCGAAAAGVVAGAFAAGEAVFPPPPRSTPASTNVNTAANGSTNAVLIEASPQDSKRLYPAPIARGNRRLGYCARRSTKGGKSMQQPAATLSRTDWRLILLASLGGALEFYDFVV